MDPTRFIPDRTTPHLQAENTREQARFVPHVIILRQMERLDEAMAAKRDPWPAFKALTSTLNAWGKDDAAFKQDWNDAVDEYEREKRRHWMHHYETVAILRTPYIRLMRRMGLFDKVDHGGGTELDRLRGGGN